MTHGRTDNGRWSLRYDACETGADVLPNILVHAWPEATIFEEAQSPPNTLMPPQVMGSPGYFCLLLAWDEKLINVTEARILCDPVQNATLLNNVRPFSKPPCNTLLGVV